VVEGGEEEEDVERGWSPRRTGCMVVTPMLGLAWGSLPPAPVVFHCQSFLSLCHLHGTQRTLIGGSAESGS